MFSHIFIGCGRTAGDFGRALDFYTAVLPTLGLAPRFCDRTRPWTGWQMQGHARPLFLVGAPADGAPHDPGNGQMTAFLAPSRAAVDAAHAAALAHGGRSAGAPGLRPEYHADDYGAYFHDPAGNKLCVAWHDASTGHDEARP